jgi:predicted DNA-binding transcriptional regulator AlpA
MKTKKNKETFLKVFDDKGANISNTCKSIGISRATFYDWIKKDKKFANQIEEIKENLIDYVESQLMENIKKGDTTSIIFFLKTRGKSRGYTERQEVEHKGIKDKIHIYLPKKEKLV